MQYMTAILQT